MTCSNGRESGEKALRFWTGVMATAVARASGAVVIPGAGFHRGRLPPRARARGFPLPQREAP